MENPWLSHDFSGESCKIIMVFNRFPFVKMALRAPVSSSCQLFGGELYENNERLEGTEYMEKHMFVLNFNDIPSAFGRAFGRDLPFVLR